MFGLFKKSKVIRKSDEPLNKTETKWFKGQKVKIKTGTTVSRPNRKNYRNNRSNNQTWFKEAPLPVPNVEKKQMLISFKGGSSKIAILEGASLVEYYSAQDKKKSLVGNIYLGKVAKEEYSPEQLPLGRLLRMADESRVTLVPTPAQKSF